MKLKLALLASVLFTTFINAQIYTPNGTIQGGTSNSSVGIGTSNPEPGWNFVVDGIAALGASSGNARLYVSGGTGYTNLQSRDLTYPMQMRYIGSSHSFDSNVGIGTTSPTQKLEVIGNGVFQGTIKSSISSDTGGNIQLVNPSKNGNGIASAWMIYNMTGGYGNSLQFWAYDNLSCGGGLCSNRFTIMDNGNVGIGISIPNNKLDVNGTIHSKEVKVDMTGWSDFVFKKEYDLPTLEEVEKHIAEKGHLENIPSQEEVLKDGVNLGQMDAKLLQKIEELTLYMIEMKKEINDLKQENKELKKEIRK